MVQYHHPLDQSSWNRTTNQSKKLGWEKHGKTWLKLDMSRKQNRRIHHRVGRRLVQDHFAVRIAKRNPLKNLASLGLREHKPHADLLVDN